MWLEDDTFLSASLSSYTVSCVFLRVLRMWNKSHVVWKTPPPFPHSQIPQKSFKHALPITHARSCNSPQLCRIKTHYLQRLFLHIGNRRRLGWLMLFWYSHLMIQGSSFWKLPLFSACPPNRKQVWGTWCGIKGHRFLDNKKFKRKYTHLLAGQTDESPVR